ncbi:MAG TPA: cation-translocating P-type ATPase, partial [Candidatus Poseidoniaceae archaeon]
MVDDDEVFIDIADGTVTTTLRSSTPIPEPAPEPRQVVAETTTSGPVLEAEIVAEATGQYEVTWPLLGMDCPDCASKATRALKHLDQVWAPVVSPTAGEVRVNIDLSVGTVAEAARVLRSLGHAPNVPHLQLNGVSASSLANKNGVPIARLDRLLRRQPGVLDAEITRDDRVLLQLVPDAPEGMESDRDAALTGLLGAAPSLGLADSDRLRPDQRRLVGGAVSFALFPIVILLEILHAPALLLGGVATVAVVIGGAEMFREAAAGLKNRQIGFQVLTSMAVLGAVLLTMWEEALIVVILVAFTQHLEGDALVRAREAMQGGLDRLPRTARRSNKPHQHSFSAPMGFSLASSGMSPMQAPPPAAETWEEVPIDLVRPGDKLQIRSGELIPADGVIVAGTGSLDMAPLTGESVPVDVESGDELNAGLVLQRGPVEIEVSATGDDTRLSGLIEAVHTFREEPPRLQGLVERFTTIWVPIVLFGSVVIWRVLYPDDITTMLLLWVVACPCALLLAAPMPHAAILARAAHLGAIVRGGHAMERLAKVDHVLLDKTGTLTSGRPTIGEIT